MHQSSSISPCFNPPFGSAINEMQYKSDTGGSYRYGFNGMEKDNESFADAYDFGARIYDGRLGRWLSLDPLMVKYPELSSYNFVANNPIFFIDPDGKEIIPSDAFKASNYNTVHDYLLASNNAYKSLLGKYATPSKDFVLTLGTDDTKIPTGYGGFTKYTYTPKKVMIGEVPFIKVATANSAENFVSSQSATGIDLWKFYIIVHEAGHSAEALYNKIALLNNNNHNGFNLLLPKIEDVFRELNTSLNLNLDDTQIKEISLYGTDDSDEFKKYIGDLAQTNKTTVEDETKAFNDRVATILNRKVEIPSEKKENK